jgi:putative membrane protein
MTDVEPSAGSKRQVRMANERTFLAWLRTSIAVMAFGFVVERFSLFLREISSVLGVSPNSPAVLPPSHGYAAIIGIILVALGTLMGALAFFR